MIEKTIYTRNGIDYEIIAEYDQNTGDWHGKWICTKCPDSSERVLRACSSKEEAWRVAKTYTGSHHFAYHTKKKKNS